MFLRRNMTNLSWRKCTYRSIVVIETKREKNKEISKSEKVRSLLEEGRHNSCLLSDA